MPPPSPHHSLYHFVYLTIDYQLISIFTMAHKKKKATDFRLERANYITSLNDNNKQSIRNIVWQYKTLIEQRRCGKKPLTVEHNQLLDRGPLYDNFLLRKSSIILKHNYAQLKSVMHHQPLQEPSYQASPLTPPSTTSMLLPLLLMSADILQLMINPVILHFLL